VWEHGEETDSDEDDDEEEEEEVVTDNEWDDLESEDTLIGIPSSMQGPYPFHVGGSESVRMAEAGRTIGPSSEQVGVGGSAAALEVLIEGGDPIVAPLEAREASPSAQEQGAGSKWSRTDEAEQRPRGSSPKWPHPTALM